MKRKTKDPARNATPKKSQRKPLTEMDTDEILEVYGHCVAGRERREKKKEPKMKVSGKKVFTLKEIIIKRLDKASE